MGDFSGGYFYIQYTLDGMRDQIVFQHMNEILFVIILVILNFSKKSLFLIMNYLKDYEILNPSLSNIMKLSNVTM